MKMNPVVASASALAVCLFFSNGCASRSASTKGKAAIWVAPDAAQTPAVALPAPGDAPVAPVAQPKPALKFVRVDCEETVGEDGQGANAVDGKPETIWHTQWQDATPVQPHEIVIELTPPIAIKGFTYLPRQDDNPNGTIKGYEFYVSNDNLDFGQPVAKGEFTDGNELKTVSFAPKTCRFIKLKSLSEINDGAWTSAAEIGVVPK
jgi:hypothetical protein